MMMIDTTDKARLAAHAYLMGRFPDSDQLVSKLMMDIAKNTDAFCAVMAQINPMNIDDYIKHVIIPICK